MVTFLLFLFIDSSVQNRRTVTVFFQRKSRVEIEKFKERENFPIEEEEEEGLDRMIWGIHFGKSRRRKVGLVGGKTAYWNRDDFETIRVTEPRWGGFNVISPKLTILRGGNEAIQWVEGGGGEGGQSLVEV